MVFSSIPPYLDPSTWHQHQQQQQQNHPTLHHGSSSRSFSISNPLLPPPPLPPPPHPPAQPPPHTGPTSIRPGSMAERARMANIPMPEAGLKCPRCESTNTKFCYFNNYNLSQPRHFCKACRRYWTRGGSLRNIPVGGGCRRNKRSKSSSSKSSSSSAATAATSSASLAGGGGTHSSVAVNMTGHLVSPLQTLTDFGDMGFQLGSIGSGGVEQWRIPPPPAPQVRFLGGLDAAGAGAGLYRHPFEGVEFSGMTVGGGGGPARLRAAEPVKAEESGQEVGLARRFSLGMSQRNVGEYDWGSESSSGNAWTY